MYNKMRYCGLVCLIFCFGYVRAHFSMGEPINSQEEIESEESLLAKIRDWLTQIKNNGIPDECEGGDQDTINNEDYLIRHIACHEPNAIKRYTFSQPLDSNNKLEGRGTVTISNSAPEQKRCIWVMRLFDMDPPDIIETDFDQGTAYRRANLTWTALGMKADLHLKLGMPHGTFKVEATEENIWTIANFNRAKVDSECWIVQPNQVANGDCTGLFKLNKIHPVNVFTHDISLMIFGKFMNASDTLLQGNQGTLNKVVDHLDCSRTVYGSRTGPPMIYHMDTQFIEYNYDTENLCESVGEPKEGPDAVGKALLNYTLYMGPTQLDTTPLVKKGAKHLLSYIEPIDDMPGRYEATLTLLESSTIDFRYIGNYNDEGQFHGQALLQIDPKKNCFRGKCKPSEYVQIQGRFEDGVLQGMVMLHNANNTQITFATLMDGIVHSMVVTFGLVTQYNNLEVPKLYKKDAFLSIVQRGMGFLAKFQHGKPVGPVIYGLVGMPIATQGFLYGKLDKKGKLTGDDIAYIYPGGRMALVGKFKDKYMVDAKQAAVTRLTCKDQMIQVEFSEPTGTSFYFDVANSTSIGEMPLMQDPYEAATVRLANSTIPNSGQGLFAIRDIKHLEVLALYNGMLFNETGVEEHSRNCYKKFDKLTDEVVQRCHKYSIHNYLGAQVDIPMELDDQKLYSGSLAHKVNNRFHPFTNANFGNMEHPRFGVIVTITSTKDIPAGDEVFLDYGYGPSSRLVFPWYFEQKDKTMDYVKAMENGEDVSHLEKP